MLRPADLDGVEPWRLLGRSQRAATRYLEPRLLAHLGEAVLLAADVLVLEPLVALPGDYVTLVPRVLEPVASEDVLADGLFDSGLVGARPPRGPVLEWWREREDERLQPRPAGRTCSRPRSSCSATCRSCATRPTASRPGTCTSARSRARARSASPASIRGRPDRLAAQVPDLCEDYADRLREAGWVERPEDEPIAPFARLANGVAVDGALRDLVATGIAEGVEFGDLTSLDGAHRLLEFANGPAAAGAAQGVTRYLEALRARRLDLQDSFQALEDEDGERFVHWARTDGRREGVPEALAPQPAPEAWSGGGEPPGIGVNVAGYLRTGLGVGEAARLYVAALETAGVPVRAEVVDPGLPQPKRTAFGTAGPRRVPLQPRLRQRVRAAGLRAPDRRGVLRGQAHDRRLGVGGLDAPGGLGRRRSRSSTRSGRTRTTSRACSPPRRPCRW